MKTTSIALIATLALALTGFAAEKKKEGGPNGGRLITAVQPNLEFVVTKDRKVEINAIKDGKNTPLSGQVVAVTAGDRSKPTKLEFKEEGGKLVSTSALPAGNDYPVSVSIKADAKAKATYEKFNLNMEKCPTCKYLEYACVCAH